MLMYVYAVNKCNRSINHIWDWLHVYSNMYCVQVNVSVINARLSTNDPVDIEAICYPVTTTTPTPITTLITTGNRPMTTLRGPIWTSTESPNTSIRNRLETTAHNGGARPVQSTANSVDQSTNGAVTRSMASTQTTPVSYANRVSWPSNHLRYASTCDV